MYNLYLLGLQLALTAYVYSNVLTEPGMILNGLYNWMEEALQAERKGWGQWVFKPLIGCFYCVAGQFAMWGYIVAYRASYNVFEHIFFICYTIFTVHLLHLIYTWKK